MTRPSLVCFLALGLLLPTLMSSIYWHDSLHGGKQQAHQSMGIPAPHIMDLAHANKLTISTSEQLARQVSSSTIDCLRSYPPPCFFL